MSLLDLLVLLNSTESELRMSQTPYYHSKILELDSLYTIKLKDLPYDTKDDKSIIC